MKRILSFLLALALILSLAGCGQGSQILPVETTEALLQGTTTQSTTAEVTESITDETTAEATAETEIPEDTTQTIIQPQKPETVPETSAAATEEVPETTAAATEEVTESTEETTEATVEETTEATVEETTEATEEVTEPVLYLDPDGSYTTKEDVGLYLHLYGCLPPNFMTKSEARALGWSGGSLERYAPGMCIGGDRFGNREGLLPNAPGRTYYECDIDTLGGGSRGAKRIVYSNDGLIYYTSDHYASFTLLYGEV